MLEPIAVVVAGLLLAIERAVYVLICRFPTTFAAWCAHPAARAIGGPVDVVRLLFVLFKGIQAAVFAGWIWMFSGGRVSVTDSAGAVAAAIGLIAVGQVLNAAVFARLGVPGVFYGNRFGYALPRVASFPFSIVSHPQYLGAVLTIWGLFLLLRFPDRDWFLLPLVESAYYALGSRLETDV